MQQTEGPNEGTDALQHQDDQQLAHESPPRSWIIRNWKAVASVGGLLTAAGVGVALLDWASRAIDDVAAALNFFTQNTFSLLIFLAVIVQAVISNRQWRAMKDSVDRTDTMIENMQGQLTSMVHQEEAMQGQWDAMKHQTALIGQQVDLMIANERAYLFLRNWEVPKFENGFLILDADFYNGGRTPAWEIQGHTRVGVDYEPRPGFPSIPSAEDEAVLDGQPFLFIAANDKVHLPLTPLKVTDTQRRLVEAGEMKIFVDGVCRYVDSLGGKQFYTYGFTIGIPPDSIHPRYERHHRVKADGKNPQ